MKRAWFRELLRRRIAVILLLVLQALFMAYAISSESWRISLEECKENPITGLFQDLLRLVAPLL